MAEIEKLRTSCEEMEKEEAKEREEKGRIEKDLEELAGSNAVLREVVRKCKVQYEEEIQPVVKPIETKQQGTRLSLSYK